MHRPSFAPPPAQSPPLHHPVPQHVSTVPMMRSPPPPVTQQAQTSSYGNPYQPASGPGGNGAFAPGFEGFINDPTAHMGFQVGKTAMMAGQEYMEQNVWKYPTVTPLIVGYVSSVADKHSSTAMSQFLLSNTTSMSQTPTS
jgi:hypothetical protein